MPILKVPVIHKFGIISHSQRVELQQRLLHQTYDEKHGRSTFAHQARGNPLEVSEQFVQKYNLAAMGEKQILQDKAEKMLQRSKRRCGLLTLGEGDHVDIPLAWSELAVLAQCKGKLQEDCFDILCTSLDHAPLNEDHIPTLFFLAESTLYWLRTDSMKQAYLRTSEVKLLRMGQLVFARLLFHHLSGHLRGLAEFKMRLHTYLDGMSGQQTLYQAYPGVWLCLRFINRVGEIIIGPYAELNDKKATERITESVPALAACVYRALRVWRCATQTKIGLKKAIVAMLMAVHEFNSKDWINGFLALSLLGEAAKVNMTVCTALQDIARGVKVDLTPDGNLQQTIDHFPSAGMPTTQDTQQFDRLGSQFQAQIDGLVSDFESAIKMQLDQTDHTKDSQPRPSAALGRENFSMQSNLSSNQLKSSQKPQQATGSVDIMPGISGWCWETGFQYSQILTDICLRGSNSNIQKVALMGKWQDADVTTFRAGAANPCIESCGLVDLLEYRGPSLSGDINAHVKKNDWTWKVRYGALSGLSRLTHCLHGNEAKTGMRSAAWSLITAVQDCPVTEERVLEAIRVAQVEFTNIKNTEASISLWTRIAQQLSEIYLIAPNAGPLAPTSPTIDSPRRRIEPRTTPSPTGKRFRNVDVKRPTVREELIVHTTVDSSVPDFKTRTSLDLKRVVADQWRKELLNDQQREEKDRLKELDRKRKEEENTEMERLKQRKEKLKGKPTAMLGPYQIA